MVVVLVVVVTAAVVTGALLARVTATANAIDRKAEKIARSGRGINIATDSAIQLRRTNRLASSILENTKPLDADLTTIGELGKDVDARAKSIDGRVETIETTAGGIRAVADDIHSTAESIEAELVAVVEVAELIDRDVRLINVNLDRTIELARAIHGDTTNIFRLARAAHQTTACIDQEVGGAAGADPHCEELE